MVKTISLKTKIPKNHKVQITLPEDIPSGPAEIVMVVVPELECAAETNKEFLGSEAFGMWKDRKDIDDPVEFALKLREEAWGKHP